MNITFNFIGILLLFPFLFASLQGFEYLWKIEGPVEAKMLDVIKNNAPLASKELPISSLATLCQLADTQTDAWLEEFHSRAYFNAKIQWALNSEKEPVEVTFNIEPGPIYPIDAVDIVCNNPATCTIEPSMIGLHIGAAAAPSTIFEAEEKFLHLMALRGYPLAKIIERNVFADQKTLSVRIIFEVDCGKQVLFGQTQITGNHTVKDEFIQKKLAWKTGKQFNQELIERTQENLEATGLFSSVVIQEGQELDSNGQIPLDIQLTEAKHRTIAGGVGYSTQQGPGLSGEWEHRNFRGMGERLTAQAKVWSSVQTGQLEYMIPAFRHTKQDLRFILEAEHEKTKGYTDTSFTLSSMLDKRINDWTFLSYGLSYKNLTTTHSDNDGTFHLLKFPLQLKWTKSNNPLDPTHGMTLNAKTTPSFQIGSHSFGYWVNTATGTFYYPLTQDESLVFASKLSAGTILGSTRKEIPPSERLYSGTENTLRGYRFMSVSPLDEKHNPVGGRSMLVLSTEMRWKCSKKIGLAAFYEIGNVYANPFPDFKKGQLQSIGAGIRYNTEIGPIRFDVAVPLDRRKHVDPPCQFYMSIGQAF